MQTFNVTQIIDGDTFTVSPEWTWNGNFGNRVRPTGYDAPEAGTPGAADATSRLGRLLLHQTIELRNAATIDRGRIVCDVYLNGGNLAEYFPPHRT